MSGENGGSWVRILRVGTPSSLRPSVNTLRTPDGRKPRIYFSTVVIQDFYCNNGPVVGLCFHSSPGQIRRLFYPVIRRLVTKIATLFEKSRKS